MIINGHATPATHFAYDGCHKIYLLEHPLDTQDAINTGYTIYPIDTLEDTYDTSCSLRFISNWQLTHQYVHQFEDAEFGEHHEYVE